MPLEQTLVIIKSHAVKEENWLHIIDVYRKKGLKVLRTKLFEMSFDTVEQLYKEHVGKKFYSRLEASVTNSEVIALHLEGIAAIAVARVLNGATDPQKAAPGTIRKLYGKKLPHNAVHASADLKAAKREIRLIFGRKKIK